MNGLKARNQVVGICADPAEQINVPIDVGVDPEDRRIAHLLVGRPEQRIGNEQNEQRGDRAPLALRER